MSTPVSALDYFLTTLNQNNDRTVNLGPFYVIIWYIDTPARFGKIFVQQQDEKDIERLKNYTSTNKCCGILLILLKTKSFNRKALGRKLTV